VNDSSAWRTLSDSLAGLQRTLRASKTTNVSSSAIRSEARDFVQLYFREVRPELDALELTGLDLVDRLFQDLLILANRVNRRSTYAKITSAIRSSLDDIEARRELAIGTVATKRRTQLPHASEAERRLIATLENLVPSAALSYRQALADLGEPTRLSFRGTAAELREALREILDHLASDDDVMASPGFRLEAEQTRPTMRQKVRFILHSRGSTKTAAGTTEKAAVLVDELTASLVRSVYERASLATHVPAAPAEVRRIKSYVDNIFVDLLEI
jgi:hypothetical protein